MSFACGDGNVGRTLKESVGVPEFPKVLRVDLRLRNAVRVGLRANGRRARRSGREESRRGEGGAWPSDHDRVKRTSSG